MSESTERLLSSILLNLKDLIELQETSTALIVNAMNSPARFDNCDNCGRLTCRPFQNHEEHGHDFCSAGCLDEYVEECEETCDRQIDEFIDQKMDKFSLEELTKIENILCGESVSCNVGNIIVTNVVQTVIPSKEEYGFFISGDGTEHRVNYAIVDAYYSCDCECQVCGFKFEMPVHKLLDAKNPCKKCQPQKKTRKKTVVKTP